LVLGRGAGRALLFPLAWVALYLGPTLLVRNVQLYYMHESLAGAAVLLGMCLDRAGRRLAGVWWVALVLIGVNGALSNSSSSYHWQAGASAVQMVQQPVLEAHRGEPLDSLTFITAAGRFWRWALTADLEGPLLPELMERPGLRVRFIDYAELPARQAEADQLNLFFDIDNGFVAYRPDRPPPAPVLRQIAPRQATPGTGFNLQPDGQSGLKVLADQATPGTRVFVDETSLATIYANPHYLTALVPAELLTGPGSHSVYLGNGVSESNRVEFVVSAEAAAPSAALSPAAISNPVPLVLRRLGPSRTSAGKGFNLQPDGQSALSAICENAVPDTVIIFDGTPLATDYASDSWLTATVPAALYGRPGRYEVYLKYESSESNRVEFVVDP